MTSTVAADAKAWSTIDQQEDSKPNTPSSATKRKKRQASKGEKSSAPPPRLPKNDDAVMTIPEFCASVGISLATERRLRKAGKGAVTTDLSVRRKGVTVKHRREWLAASTSPRA